MSILTPERQFESATTFDNRESLLQYMTSVERMRALGEPLPRLYDMQTRYCGNPVFELDLTHNETHSFKSRGAFNMLAQTPYEVLRHGVATASAGNHAQGVALSVRFLNEHYRQLAVQNGWEQHFRPIQANIFMPKNVAPVKVASTQHIGGEHVRVHLVGENYDECHEEARLCQGLFVPAYDHRAVMDGQGTVVDDSLEVFEKHGLDPNNVRYFVPYGGGGLATGMQQRLDALGLNAKITAVQSEGADSAVRSREAGYRVCLDTVNPLADGTAVRSPGSLPYADLPKLDDVYRVRLADFEKEAVLMLNACHKNSTAIGDAAFDEMPEPAALLSYAAARNYTPKTDAREIWVVLRTGSNVNWQNIDSLVTQAHERGKTVRQGLGRTGCISEPFTNVAA